MLLSKQILTCEQQGKDLEGNQSLLTRMMSGLKRSAAGSTISSSAARIAASPESPAINAQVCHTISSRDFRIVTLFKNATNADKPGGVHHTYPVKHRRAAQKHL